MGIIVFGVGCQTKNSGRVTLPPGQASSVGRKDEPPVPLDASPPVEYPTALYQQRIGGTVILRLFVTDKGEVIADSTRIQESSGYPALDSAAIASAPKLHYAPALRNGTPVSTAFTQPIVFRHPDRGGTTP